MSNKTKNNYLLLNSLVNDEKKINRKLYSAGPYWGYKTKKILHRPDLEISATCVRVPVIVSHSQSVHIEFENEVKVDDAIEKLDNFPGIKILDDLNNNIYPTPLDAAGKDDVFVGRVRADNYRSNILVLWVVTDNLRKGAALNALQISDSMIEMKLVV